MTRRRTLIAIACAATTLAMAGPAVGSALGAGDPVIGDCVATGRLTQSYTVSELNHALSVMTASTKEYTNCYDVISQAVLTATANHGRLPGGAGGGSGGSFLPTPVIVILVLLALGAVTFGAVAIRRRREAEDDAAGESGRGSGTEPRAEPGSEREGDAPAP